MKYKQTHPWLSFTLDTGRFSPKLWMMLGEAQSKCHHIAGVPLQPDTAKELHSLYLAKGALATTAIEGNTLSEEEVKKQIAGVLSLPPSREYLAREDPKGVCTFIRWNALPRQQQETPIG